MEKFKLSDFKVTDNCLNAFLTFQRPDFEITIHRFSSNCITVSVIVSHENSDFSMQLKTSNDINTIDICSFCTQVTSNNLKTIKRAINFINKIVKPENIETIKR